MPKAFGGYSLLPNTIQGGWVDGETACRGDLRVYVVAMASITDGGKLGDIIEFAKIHFV